MKKKLRNPKYKNKNIKIKNINVIYFVHVFGIKKEKKYINLTIWNNRNFEEKKWKLKIKNIKE